MPDRVVVLGSGGFIGGAIYRLLAASGIHTLSLTRVELDLTHDHAGEKLSRLLETSDTLVFVSAEAPCKDMDMLVNNVRIAKAVCAALQTRPVSHVVYISSDAVYKDSREALTEASCAEPESLHGVMHLTREVALKQAYAGPLAIVRPTLVYGYEDPHNGYGPNRFRRLAADGKNIVLFGEGEELRDHVYVADIAAMVRLILIYGSSGLANAASGTVTSFRELANHAASAFGAASTITSVPRKGPMPHGGYRHFNNSAVLAAFPGFRFTPWREGLSEVYHRQLKEAQGCHYQS